MRELLHTSLVVQEYFVGDGWPSQMTSALYVVGSSGDLPPPSPPAEKATARQDQAGKARTGDWAGDGGCHTVNYKCNSNIREYARHGGWARVELGSTKPQNTGNRTKDGGCGTNIERADGGARSTIIFKRCPEWEMSSNVIIKNGKSSIRRDRSCHVQGGGNSADGYIAEVEICKVYGKRTCANGATKQEARSSGCRS